ncbi:MAG: Maf family nucleotide pyrophosphatase [Henriciella sp.]|nr:Maf family nucleotide pyrophosphatase [Henriciella sp.]
MADAPLVLASASPRRQQLLAQVGITPDEIKPANIDETPLKGELPRVYAIRMGRQKAEAVHVPGQYTLAGDTVVSVGRRILPKAESAEEVRACLELMSGRAHHVMTSVCLIGPEGQVSERLNDTRVILKRLSDREIEDYCDSGEGIGKAGGYGIQGLAGGFIKQISGSYTGIVGLPLFETLSLLRGQGYRL